MGLPRPVWVRLNRLRTGVGLFWSLMRKWGIGFHVVLWMWCRGTDRRPYYTILSHIPLSKWDSGSAHCKRVLGVAAVWYVPRHLKWCYFSMQHRTQRKKKQEITWFYIVWTNITGFISILICSTVVANEHWMRQFHIRLDSDPFYVLTHFLLHSIGCSANQKKIQKLVIKMNRWNAISQRTNKGIRMGVELGFCNHAEIGWY